MLIEDVELTLPVVGLGPLTEAALLALFGTTQAHALMAPGKTLADLRDARGRALYPAYYFTHLEVAPGALLSSLKVWDRCSVGVDVHTFGGMLLDSSYAVARQGALPSDAAAWPGVALATLRSGSMFVVEGGAEGEVGVPADGSLAPLHKLPAAPAAMARFRKLRVEGRMTLVEGSGFRAAEPILIDVVPGRDAPPGRNLMFARFTELMDQAEREVLSRALHPPVPTELLDGLAVLEREVCYFDNARSGDAVEIFVEGRLEAAPRGDAWPEGVAACAALLASFELYSRSTKALLAVARAKKVFTVGQAAQGLLRDAERLLRRHGQEGQA